MLKRAFAVLIGLMIFFVHAFSQKYEIYERTLSNGLNVIVVQNPAVPLVTVELDVKNGGYTQPPEYEGLAHLYEHMFFKANEAIPNQERYMERIRELGASWNGTTSDERVNYFITLGRDSLEPGMQFMYDAITAPLFKEEELVKERPVVLGEYDRNEANPSFLLFRAIQQKVWWKYYSYKDVLGDRNVIITATPEKMHTIQHLFYIPNNSALILAGDITANEGFDLAEKYFGKWKKGTDPFTTIKIPEHPPIQRTETIVVEHPVSAASVSIEWQGPSVSKDPKATYAADVFSYILSQQTSTFYKDLVESGLAYGVNFSYNTLNHVGPITLSSRMSPDKYEACKKAIFAELSKMMSDDYFTDEQLENAKTILAIDEQYGREQASQYAHTVGYWWAVAGLDYYLDYVDNVNKVTRDDIKRYLATYVIDKPYVMGVLVSSEMRKQLGL
ncbi:MAG TPA: pitrilysin family protein [Bacteroidota bacterium]|nr:pitrilysin family protein [Bacteroidota bacterium]